MSNLRQQILTQAKIPSRTFTPDGFPADVEVRGMTGAQRAEFLEYSKETKKSGGADAVDLREFYPLFVLGYVYDPSTGERVFADSDGAAILGLPGTALEQISNAVLQLSGMGEKAEAVSRDVSSEASGATTTGSPNA